MHSLRTCLAAAFALAMAGAVGLAAQSPSAPPSFEVASIKPNKSGRSSSSSGIRPGGRYVASNLTLELLIREAYSLQDFQLVDAPEWTRNEHFDISATAGRETTSEEMRQMVRALLAERFGLVVHRDTRELPTYELVMARPDRRFGLELKQAAFDCSDPANKGRAETAGVLCGINTNTTNNSAVMQAGSIPISRLAFALSQFVNRIVTDRTGLAGGYEAKLSWTPNPSADTSGASLFTALQEQLGLRLESARGPVEVVIVDKVDRPTPD